MDKIGIIEQINSNLGLINIILSFIVTGSTLIYSILSWRLTNETKLMREVYTEPKISVTVEENDAHDDFFDLIIKNIGLGPAYDINFSVIHGEIVDGITLTGIRQLSALNKGVSYLGPNQTIKSNISYIHNNEQFFDTSFKIISTYSSRLNKKYTDNYNINFSEFEGITSVNDHSYEDAKKIIKRIADMLENISDVRKEIRVVVQTSKTKEAQTKDRILSHREYLKK